MRRHGASIRRYRLDAHRPAVQGAVAHPRQVCQQAARRETRRLGPLPLCGLAARAAHPQRFLGSRDLQEQGTGRAPRTEKPLDHLQRLLSGYRGHDDHLLVQGDRSLLGLRSCRCRRTACAGRSLGRKYGPCFRQGLLRQQYQTAAVGSLRQYRRAVVRRAAESLREAHFVR